MNTAAERPEVKNPKTGMTHGEMKEFIRNHFEEFVNRKNLRIGEANFAMACFLRLNCAGLSSTAGGRFGRWAGVSRRCKRGTRTT